MYAPQLTRQGPHLAIGSTTKAILAAFGFSLPLRSPTLADPVDERAKELLAWVAGRTGYSVGHLRMTIVFAQPMVINAIAFGAQYTYQTSIVAVSAGATIFLPTWFELGRNDILVHELIHVLRYENNATFRCAEEREREAYQVQADFSKEMGLGNQPSSMSAKRMTRPIGCVP